MYQTTGPFLQYELDYRQARLKNGLTGPKRRHHRILPRVLRPGGAGAADDTTR